MIILVAIFLVLIGYFVYHRLVGPLNYWKSRGIPFASGALPIFGNTLSVYRLKESLTTFSARIYNENVGKSMVGFFNMGDPVLMVRDPDLVKIVLQTNFKAFQNNAQILDLKADPLLGRDTFFLRGTQWRDAKPIFGSTLSVKKVKLMTPNIESACQLLKDYLSVKMGDKESLELDSKLLFSRYTNAVSTRNVFSIEANSFKEDYSGTYLEVMKKNMDPSLVKSFLMNILLFLPFLNKYINTSFVTPAMDAYFRKIVKDLEETRKHEENGAARNDVFQMMLDLHRAGKISYEEALGHAFSFSLESFETSSLILSFVAYELGKHEEIQEKLRHEVENVLKKHEGRLTYESIQEMTYMDDVINETLRLFPGVGNILRLTTEKCRLEGFDGLSVDLEPDTAILIPVLGLHRDPEIWQNPEKFDPTRFSTENNDLRHKFSFLPFGEGPRICPGIKLGCVQIKAALAVILPDYCIQVSPKMIEPVRINPQYFLTSALGGFWMKLRPLRKR